MWFDNLFRRPPEPSPSELEARLKGQVDSLKAQLPPLKLRATLPGAPKGINDEITNIQNLLNMLHNQIGVGIHAGHLDQKRVRKDLAEYEKALRDLAKRLPPARP